MFFFFSKMLLFLLSPFFWLMLSIGLYIFWKNPRWKKILKWTSVGIFLFFSNSVIFSLFCGMWEYPGIKQTQLKQHDVAIVLGGMSEYNNDLDVLSIRRPGDRIFQAVTLYKKGKVKKILISGDSGHLGDRGLHEARQMKEILIGWDIPENDIITEEKSTNTHQNAQNTCKLLRRSYPEFKSFVLITSGIHMRRAMGCFQKEGLNVTPYSTDLYTNQTRNFYWDQYLIPNVGNFPIWQDLLKEMVGYAIYDIAGYI
ncbi:YdcF family protein [Crocinitomicaceae bacterium]|nr:YdcF family protein [Crocinitomicaceae bacterium]